MIESLVDAACDRDEGVRKAIAKSLVDIGRKKYVSVLKICHTYLMKHNKVSERSHHESRVVRGQLSTVFSSPFNQLPRSHRTILLQLMEKIAKEHIHDISEELAKELIALGSAELTLTDVSPPHERWVFFPLCTLTLPFSFPTPQMLPPIQLSCYSTPPPFLSLPCNHSLSPFLLLPLLPSFYFFINYLHPQQEILPDWQTAASALLSTLGIQHAKLVLQELLTKFKPGCNPHFFVVQTLGQLAVSNGTPMLVSFPGSPR